MNSRDKQESKRGFILGTDWWDDCDDAVALRLLSRAQKRGEIELLGVGINACMEHSVASVRGFLRAEGLDGIPVGIDLEATDFGGTPPYQKRLSENFAPEITNACAEDAARMYRRILAESKRKVEIIEIGFLQVLAALLESPADDLSPLTGIELVGEKVRHIWIMGGKWDIQGGRENNFSRNERARRAAAAVCECCPVPITFLGFEVGYDVISGGNLENTDHLYSVLLDHGSQNGRKSWDPMLTLLAIIGDCEKAGYTAVCGRASVDPETGLCYFERGDGTSHRYVIKNRENSFYENQINSLL